MSKENPVISVTILLDRSGSMEGPTKADHIGGMKSFVKDQQNQPGETRFNFIQFDSHNSFELIYDNIDINKVDPEQITLIPRGSTPLIDAVGKTIAHIEEQEQKSKSDQVVLMIITDGHENSSREWTVKDIKHIIKQKKNDWQFMFLGASLDNFDDAINLGISADNYINAKAQNTHNIYQEYTSSKINQARRSIVRGDDKTAVLNCMNYTQEDRNLQGEDYESVSDSSNT